MRDGVSERRRVPRPPGSDRAAAPLTRLVQDLDQAGGRKVHGGSSAGAATLLDPAPDADEPALERLRIAGLGAQQAAIAAPQGGREPAPPVGIEVEIDHAAHLRDAGDAALGKLEGAADAQESGRRVRRPHLVGGIRP